MITKQSQRLTRVVDGNYIPQGQTTLVDQLRSFDIHVITVGKDGRKGDAGRVRFFWFAKGVQRSHDKVGAHLGPDRILPGIRLFIFCRSCPKADSVSTMRVHVPIIGILRVMHVEYTAASLVWINSRQGITICSIRKKACRRSGRLECSLWAASSKLSS